MIYQVYYDAHSYLGVDGSNSVVVPFGVFKARQLPRMHNHVYDDEKSPNLTDHNTLCEWRVLYYVWKHHAAQWVGFTSWSHNQKGFYPKIESVEGGQCERALRIHNIVGFCLRPLKSLIPADIASEFGITLKTQFLQWALAEQRNKLNIFDKRKMPLGKYHHLVYWDFVIQEYQSLYGINLERELDFRALGNVTALHTWCNSFICNWQYFNDYMKAFSPVVLGMLDHFGSHPTDLELSYICERLIILHNYIKYTNNEFKTPANQHFSNPRPSSKFVLA